MDSLQFFKYQGTGNDFIMIDNRDGNIQLTTAQVQQLCDRKFGIGSDGLVLIESTSEANFHMNFFNPDGSQSFCGNGSRCAVRFAQQLGVVSQNGSFIAIDGLHDFNSDERNVHIHMRDVEMVQSQNDHYIINTGSPHYIQYVTDLDKMDVVSHGRSIRYNETFKAEGINVNFVEENDHGISIRTYERGVEDETLSCGTGVTAAALSYHMRHPEVNELTIKARGGELFVKWKHSNGRYTDIYLCGPAELVFDGKIYV